MAYVQGDNRHQSTMFSPILDDYITENNPACVIDAFVDSLDLLELGFSKSKPAETG